MGRGQQRAKDDSSKGKGKKEKGESSSSPTLERNTPYFTKDKDQERYNINLSLHKVLNCRWIDYNFFKSYNFEFSAKFDNLGWKSITNTKQSLP